MGSDGIRPCLTRRIGGNAPGFKARPAPAPKPISGGGAIARERAEHGFFMIAHQMQCGQARNGITIG
jgi:hypothetical protein